MATIDVDALLEHVRTAPSEGEALKRLSAVTKIALEAVKRIAGGVVPPDAPAAVKAKADELAAEIDNLIENMTIDTPKVDKTMVEPRNKAPILPPPPEKPPEKATQAPKQDAEPKHAEAGSKK